MRSGYRAGMLITQSANYRRPGLATPTHGTKRALAIAERTNTIMNEVSRKSLLIICNMPSSNTRLLANAAARGASHEDIVGVDVHLREPLNATAQEVLDADAILLGTTENFGYMSGLMKDFFERIYYLCLEKTEGKPYALYVRGGNDGQGARIAVERIIAGLRWKAAQPALVLKGEWQTEFEEAVHELGQLMAASLEAGIL